MTNGYCVNVIAVKTGPVQFDREHQSKGGGNEGNRRVKAKHKDNSNSFLWREYSQKQAVNLEKT